MTVHGPVHIRWPAMCSALEAASRVVSLRPVIRQRSEENRGDLLAKVELPFFGGKLELLGYDCENELNAGAVADPTDALLVRRHGFEWGTRSLGATWEGSMGSSRVAVRAWDSRSASSATLRSEVGDAAEARSGRTESGVMATLARPTSAEGELLVGVRLSRGSTGVPGRVFRPLRVPGGTFVGGASAWLRAPDRA